MTNTLRQFRLFGRGVDRDQRGTSLVESMITVALLGLVMATVFVGFESSRRTVMGTDDRLRNLDEARVLVAATTKDLRTAARLSAGTSPFVFANKNEVTFYANLGTTLAPKKVHIYIDASSRLVEEAWTATGVDPNYVYTGAATIRLVGRYIANTSAQPIFTYLDDTGTALVGAPLSGPNLLAVKSVRISLQVRRTTAYDSPITTVMNQVRLPNLDYEATS